MKGEIKGHEHILHNTINHYEDKIKFIQEGASFKLIALETALAEVKLRH